MTQSRNRFCSGFFFIVALCSMATQMAVASEYEERLRNIAMNDIKKWAHDPAIIAAIKVQNEAHYNLSATEIEKLDKQWQLEINNINQPLIKRVTENPLSDFLRRKQFESDGLYREIIIMDNRGLNIGQSVISTDYWQGDEAKWLRTFKQGVNGLHISDVEYDDSARAFQSQVSLTIAEGDEPIGAITVGVDTEQFDHRK